MVVVGIGAGEGHKRDVGVVGMIGERNKKDGKGRQSVVVQLTAVAANRWNSLTTGREYWRERIFWMG